MTMVTLDQIEKWKRDSEILTEIDEKLDVKDDWQDHEDFSCPDAFKYYVWKARKNSKQDSRYHKVIGDDSCKTCPSCDRCGKTVDERSLDFFDNYFVCQSCRKELE